MLTPLSDRDIEERMLTRVVNPVGAVQGQSSPSRWLVNWIARRIRENRPGNLVATGETGSGKSYNMMRLGVNVDEDFTVDNILFTIPDFITKLNTRPPAGTVLMVDEAGLFASNRDWHQDQQMLFGKTAQSMRYRGILVFYTVPRLPFVDITTRQLIQILLESMPTRGRMKPFFIRPAANRNDNRPWYYYPTRTITRNWRTYVEQIRVVNFEMPPKWIYMPYEKRKDEYLTALYEGFEEQIKNSETGKEETEFGIKLVCSNCKFGFQYKGKSWSPKCKRCGAPVDIPTALKPYVGIEHVKLQYSYAMDPTTGNVMFITGNGSKKKGKRKAPTEAPDVPYAPEGAEDPSDNPDNEEDDGIS